MADWRDQLAEMEAALGDLGQLTCPVCRLAQPADTAVCGRCSADLSLLAGVLAESARTKTELYQAVARGDAVAALSELDAAAQLTGPSQELAVLRRLLRHGTVPLEVLADLAPEAADDEEPLAVYVAGLTDGQELQPEVEADPERAAFAGLWPAAEADLEPLPDIEPEPPVHRPHHAEPHPSPEPEPTHTPAAAVVTSAQPQAVASIPPIVVWIVVMVAAATLIMGVGIGWLLHS